MARSRWNKNATSPYAENMKRLLAATIFACLAACSSPIPTCVPGEAASRLCDQDELYSCRAATAEELTAANMVRAQCDSLNVESPEYIQCLAGLEYEFIDTTLVSDCAAVGEVCVETATSSADARCEAPAT